MSRKAVLRAMLCEEQSGSKGRKPDIDAQCSRIPGGLVDWGDKIARKGAWNVVETMAWGANMRGKVLG